jgi:hypothetical protein
MMSEDPIRDMIEYHSEAICTAYVIVATTETIEGEPKFYITTLTNQTASTTLGLLESASAGEKYRIARFFAQNMDDDEN